MSRPVTLTTLDVARRFLGVEEQAGAGSNPLVLGWLRMAQAWPASDAVPWCGAFVGFVAHVLGLPTPLPHKLLAARSWLNVGEHVEAKDAQPGDVVVLERGGSPTAGHVGFFAGWGPRPGTIRILGGNQADSVSYATFSTGSVLGFRRL